jgi:UDP-N-acetylglucosamine 4,6-dehydratase
MLKVPDHDIDLSGSVILLTGGTGSFGTAFAKRVVSRWPSATVRVFSRDEYKQSLMAEKVASSQLRFQIGDVRDRSRLFRAMRGCDVVIHAAAMKQVPACEYNPFEAVQTNVIGAQNVADAALDLDVEHVIGLSTDKAVNPVNLYGATKLCGEKLMIQANAYRGEGRTRISCVRYGNVVGSRGSVVEVFRSQRDSGPLTITDPRMTRFWITLDEAVDLVLYAIADQRGGEVYVPCIPSVRVTDLAEAIAPGVPRSVTGIRPGEKLHEVLLTADESYHAVRVDDVFIVVPEHPWWDAAALPDDAKPLEQGFAFSSDSNQVWLTVEQISDYFSQNAA